MTKPVISRESFSARIWRKTLAGVGVKFGLGWVALLVFCAVFAPFLANSMPLLMSKDGVISAPVLEYLSVEDAWILASFFIALAVYRLNLAGGKQILLFLLGSALAALAVNMFVKPPALVIYDDFRSSAYTQVDWKIMPPIPYAPVDYLRDLGSKGLEAPFATEGHTHLMGTEENGADVLSRMIHACRISLSIGLIASGIALAIGIVVGGLMGYFSGIVDMLGMRLVEIFEDIPTLFLLLTFVAFFGRSLYMMMVIIGVTGWSGYARYVRQEFLKLRKQDYVQAAVASGLPLTSILFRHMLPNGVAPLLVAVSFGVAGAILSEATLSFLGLGVVDAPSWGAMLDQAVKSSTFNWWMAVFPGGSIFMTVFAYNLIGEAFRDAIDPRLSDKAGVKS
ncbi:ABC transporter permease [Methylomonas methanica]|uniref:ABC transporter permease n=1 Tax=Methylomonas methanica TaxID=421 RepID=A0A177LYG8_METMH|nr:ABC transporter permease [Methylomonas methanica]OAH98517.1 ABC transporter permease [Methylomonas methanica]